jgi:serine/threonine protein kinase
VDTELRTFSIVNIAPGTVVAGRYEVQNRIGSGGMGVVFRVIDRELNNEIVALKALHAHLAEDEKVFARFRNEVLVARSLSHPNIVRIHDIGKTESGSPYISMEYVDGYSLDDRIAGRLSASGVAQARLDFKELVKVLFQVAIALGYAHAKEIIHRDLKPANVMLTKGGEVKLADFGMARIIGVKNNLTQTGQAVGTPDYMSPEQIRGEHTDGRCDIYALGIMAYELAVGERPFSADSSVAIAFKHLNQPIPKFATKDSNIPIWFEELVLRATAKDINERMSSAFEFSQVISEHMPEVVDWTGMYPAQQTGSFQRVSDGTSIKENSNRFELGTNNDSRVSDNWEFGLDGKDEHPISETITNKKLFSYPALLLLTVILLCVGAFTVFEGHDLLIVRLKQNVQLASTDQPESSDLVRIDLERELLGLDEVLGPELLESEIVKDEIEIFEEVAETQESTQESIVEKSENIVKYSEEVIVEPSVEPTVEISEPIQVAKVVAEPKEVRIIEKTKYEPVKLTALLTFKDSFYLDELDKALWQASVMGLHDDYSPSMQEIQREYVVNVFNPTKQTLVARLRPQDFSKSDGDKMEINISGNFSDLLNTEIEAGRLRFDLVRIGEVMTSKELVLQSNSLPTEEKEEIIDILQGSSELPPARRLSEFQPARTVYEQYTGTLRVSESEPRTLILDINFGDSSIEGTASIDGFGRLLVTGSVTARGFEMVLQNDEFAIRLTGARQNGNLRGLYSIPAEQKRGAWDASLLRIDRY